LAALHKSCILSSEIFAHVNEEVTAGLVKAGCKYAYSHEVISHGFWPGNSAVEPVFTRMRFRSPRACARRV